MPRKLPEAFCQLYAWDERKRLDKGNTASVYAIPYKRTGQLRAVKLLRVAAHASADIERELSVLALLKHPNVLRYHESFANEHYVLMVTEYCAGGDLFGRAIEENPQRYLDEEVARGYAAQLLSALQYCHGSLVAHRDLKLDNVFLTADGTLKLGDFGFSREYEPRERSRTFCGTPEYSAPEIVFSAQYEPMLADIWSFGIVLATLTLGHFPISFQGKNQVEAFEDVFATGVPNLDRRVDKSKPSAELVALLRALLQVKPKARLRLEHIARHPWMRGAHVDARLPVRAPCNQIRRDIIECIVSMGFAAEEVWRSVIDNDCTQLCVAIYHLLHERVSERNRATVRLRGSRSFSESELRGINGPSGPASIRGTPTRGSDTQLMAPHSPPRTPPSLLRRLRRSARKSS